jgi:uncharacterized protein (DUF2252 family)
LNKSIPTTGGQREALLDRRRQMKMARSAHAYVRGSTEHFYEWLNARTVALPEGPAIWICGDCHLGNLGPVARSNEQVEVELRDLDQTVRGNPAHDVLRLGLSLAMAARGSDLPGVTTAQMVEEMMRGYEGALRARMSGRKPAKKPPARPVRLLMQEALRRSWRHLLDERLGQSKAVIPMGSRFWPLTRTERVAIEDLFKTKQARKLVASLRCRDDDADITVVDAAYWVKGCSSLGKFRAAVLVRAGDKGGTIEDGSICLMDVKEGVRSSAPWMDGETMPRHHGERVVKGARSLAPFLGERMLAGTILKKPVFVRELLPQDLKLEINRISESDARDVARFLAGVVGTAHASQMDREMCGKWLSALRGRYSKSLDAPAWLWSSLLDLIAVHERAYLEHCRKHALGAHAAA